MNKTVLAALSAVGGGIVGGVITYVTVNKKLVRRYEDWANDEISKVRAHYNERLKEAELASAGGTTLPTILDLATNPTPEMQAAVEKGKKLIEAMGYSPEDGSEIEHPTAQRLSIFDQAVAVDEKGNPIEERDSEPLPEQEAYLDEMDDGYKIIDGEPYLISEADYFENEPEYELDTLTYYEIDDTLTDEKNSQIDTVQDTVGERHMHMFHKRKGAKKTSLYIRNDDHQTLYEVILVEGAYASMILGMTDEELGLKPAKKKIKKMPKDGD